MANRIGEERSTRIVANWIFLGVGMLIIQVLLGGITRLTGSGLSITEWKPIMGALPPMNEADWQTAFNKYQQIAQYKYINNHFTLTDFKFIFFWEWFHRVWARFIGVVFLIPFIYFLVKGYFKKWMINPLIILFLLGALQGAIGWIMVQSGLNQEDVYVNHIRLAAHFMAAMVLICYALIFGMKLTTTPQQKIVSSSLKNFALIILLILVVQLTYGAFMAGLKAATAAPTWPDVNGVFAPDMSRLHWTNNPVAVQFIHRMLAYSLLVLLVWWWFAAKKQTASTVFNKTRNWVLMLVILQVALGIFSVINSLKIVPGQFGTFEWLALAHQLVGMLLLLMLVAAFYLLRWSGKYTT
jgi:cytochrome c oxidase assembly protein subunit 15